RLYIIQRFTDGSISRIGNPNNTLSKTVAYELGYEHNLFNQFLLHLAAYYKDVTDQPNWIRYTSVDRKVNYLKADENFYEDIRGFEISVGKRSGTWITGFINYTYMVSTSGYFDKLIYYENPAEQREYDRQNIYQEKPIPRPYFRANIDLHTPSDFGPKFATMKLLGDWHTSLLIIWREGWYSTWTRGASIPGIQYNVQWPDYLNVDMRWSKDLRLGKYNIQFFLDISNLLNTKIFSSYAFSDGNDYRDYMDSLLWPKKIGEPLGYTQYGNDRIGNLRPDNVKYDPLEPNPDDDPEIEARNKRRRDTKSYIDNPNLKWLYYLNPRDIFFGIRIYF
ncbi:MAG: TonB-dependent receptor, partial [candidate division WOR-3 bacterium]|nr:TonB-dependent receptor [candidate division WOR-3 bacterium]